MGRASALSILTGGVILAFTSVAACGSGREGFDADPSSPNGQDGGGNSSGFLPSEGGIGDGAPGLPVGETRDPVDCEEAKTTKSYVGCDYWPTVTPNAVWSIFDYAVVVANTGSKDADVTITGPNAVNKMVKVPAGELRKIYLPWVASLKGGEADECGKSPSLDNSVVVSEGAYHLVSSSPVIVYQFNALQYKGEGGEAPDGGTKDWSECPGSAKTCPGSILSPPQKIGCFSFSNDASLLLPSTAMTNNYRVLAHKGASGGPAGGGVATALTITATQPDTDVTVSLSGTARVVASASGPTVPATSGGGKVTLKLAKAGAVAQLVSAKGTYDFSGSLVQSTKPVQVIASIPCINIPEDRNACDHIEESVPPAETLGKHYVITPPTGPKGTPVQHKVRLYGNRDGTKLTYSPAKPAKCPDTLNAGQVADCDLVKDPFEVTGDQEFGVATFGLGAEAYGGSIFNPNKMGDPDQSSFASVEQFRTKYVFLAPNDYPVLWADITATEDAPIELDGKPLSVPWNKIGNGPFGVYRVDLTKSGQDGAHTLTSKKPVGVQVIGFGDYTSFQYPAGLNLNIIAPPPVK
jgi:hypothetical protein